MTRQLEVGKTYTSMNGDKWRCIAVNGGIAHMQTKDDQLSVAHAWHVDGTHAGRNVKYNIVFKPERGAT